MERLYLIRRKLEAFVGPLTAQELKESFQRMDFGLQDEVAGHCGEWITLENRKALIANYPEIVNIFYPGFIDTQSDASASSRPVSEPKNYKKRPSPPPVEEVPQEQRSKLAAIFFTVGMLMAAVAVYLMQSAPGNLSTLSSLGGSIFSGNADMDELSEFFRKGDLPGYTKYIESHRDKILRDVAQSRGKESPWLPYIRFYAFQGRGEFPGLSSKQLRGSGAYTAPADCSLDVWKKTWLSGKDQWSDLIYGSRLVKANWGRVLAWDPHWLIRRKAAGWIEPPNFHGACIYMAFLAFEEINADTKLISAYKAGVEGGEQIIESIRSRLGWLSYAVNRTPTFNGAIVGATSEGFLAPSYWTCLEVAGSYSELENCRRGYSARLPLWNSFEQDRLLQSIIRITMKDKKRVGQDILDRMEGLRSSASTTDHFTRFDVRPELGYLDQLLKHKGDVAKSLPKVSQELDSVDFNASLAN